MPSYMQKYIHRNVVMIITEDIFIEHQLRARSSIGCRGDDRGGVGFFLGKKENHRQVLDFLSLWAH